MLRGECPREEVVRALQSSRFFISTTRIENSYNAASEGIFFTDESYISDIGRTASFCAGMPYDDVSVPGLARPLLHVRRQQISGANLKSWDDVVGEMIRRIDRDH